MSETSKFSFFSSHIALECIVNTVKSRGRKEGMADLENFKTHLCNNNIIIERYKEGKEKALLKMIDGLSMMWGGKSVHTTQLHLYKLAMND